MRTRNSNSALLCEGACPAEPLNAAGGTLMDGTTYTVDIAAGGAANDQSNGNIIYGGGGAFDLTFTFSQPVDFTFTNTVGITTGVVVLEDTATPPLFTTDGGDWIFNQGTTGIDIILTGQTATTLGTGNPQSPDQSDWGSMVTTNATQVILRSNNNDAFRFLAAGTGKCVQPVCDVVENNCDRIDALEDADTAVSAVSAIAQDLSADTITHRDGAGNQTVLDLSKYNQQTISWEWEEGGALATSTTTSQWSVGNGAVGVTAQVAPIDMTLRRATFHAETAGTSVNIQVRDNLGAVLATLTFTGQADVDILANPVLIPQGTAVTINTGTEVGAYTDARVNLFFTYEGSL